MKSMEISPGIIPDISTVICTRNRGCSVVPAIQSILANTHPNFELIVVDQSVNQMTWNAAQNYCSDPRFNYIHSETVGLGRSRNIGLRLAKANVVAYIDDDVTVPPQWLESLEQIFTSNKKVALIYSRVNPAPYNVYKGYIPEFQINENKVIKKMSDLFTNELGIGAGMAVNKEIISNVGGFDEHLGAGSYFRSGEDRDIAIRLILKGHWVFYASKIPVIHYGYRTFIEGIEHTKCDFFGLGATYIKPVKCGYWRGLILFISVPRLRNWFEPIRLLFQLKRPKGVKKILFFFLGVMKGLMTPVDRQHILYQTEQIWNPCNCETRNMVKNEQGIFWQGSEIPYEFRSLKHPHIQ